MSSVAESADGDDRANTPEGSALAAEALAAEALAAEALAAEALAAEALAAEPPATVPLFSFGPWFWGTFAAALLPMLAITGLGLLFVFDPSAPRQSAVDLRQVSAWGFLRELHVWASHAVVIAAWLHILRVYMVGSYRRLLGWSMSIALLITVLALATTGSLMGSGSNGWPWPVLYALHCLVLPMLIIALVAFWWRRRGTVQ